MTRSKISRGDYITEVFHGNVRCIHLVARVTATLAVFENRSKIDRVTLNPVPHSKFSRVDYNITTEEDRRELKRVGLCRGIRTFIEEQAHKLSLDQLQRVETILLEKRES